MMTSPNAASKISWLKAGLISGLLGLLTASVGGAVGAVIASLVSPVYGCSFVLGIWLTGCGLVIPVVGLIFGVAAGLAARAGGCRPVLTAVLVSGLVGLPLGAFVSRAGIPVGC